MPSNLSHRRPSVENAWSVLSEEVGRGGVRPTPTPTGENGGSGPSSKPVFRELKYGRDGGRGGPSDSQLWEAGSGKQENAPRLSLRSLEAVLSPTNAAADIINAVAFAMSSQGLRLVERDIFRIRGQRIEASFLPNQPREEWRIVDARLGVSRGFPWWVLLLEFKTDPCPKQSRGAAVLASVAERLGSSGNPATAVTMAHRRSDGRARSVMEAVGGELGQLDGVAQSDNHGDGGVSASLEGLEDVVLAPFEGGGVDPEERDGSRSGSASVRPEAPQEEELEVCGNVRTPAPCSAVL